MGIRKTTAAALMLLMACTIAAAYDYLEEPIVVKSSRAQAMGGFHAADTYDMSVLFSNPGAFQVVDTQLAFSEFTLGLKGPVFDIADLVVGATAGGTGMDEILASDSTINLLRGLYAGLTLTGPLYFGYVGNGLGLGFFNNTDIVIQESAPLTLKADIREDLLLSGGYTYRIPLPASWDQTLDAGLLLKGGVRGVVTVTRAYTELLAMDFGVETLTGSPFDFIAAIGLDVGLLYRYKDILSVGITGLDVLTPTTRKRYNGALDMFEGTADPVLVQSGVIPFTLNAGISFTPSLGFLNKYVSGILFLLDYKDILGLWLFPENYKNPWLHLSAGTELTLLDIFSLRCGMDTGLFSAGLGVDLTIFTMNVALFGSELGSEPGSRPIYNLMLGLEFRS